MIEWSCGGTRIADPPITPPRTPYPPLPCRWLIFPKVRESSFKVAPKEADRRCCRGRGWVVVRVEWTTGWWLRAGTWTMLTYLSHAHICPPDDQPQTSLDPTLQTRTHCHTHTSDSPVHHVLVRPTSRWVTGIGGCRLGRPHFSTTSTPWTHGDIARPWNRPYYGNELWQIRMSQLVMEDLEGPPSILDTMKWCRWRDMSFYYFFAQLQ